MVDPVYAIFHLYVDEASCNKPDMRKSKISGAFLIYACF